MAVRWRIAIMLAVITTINYVDRLSFGMVMPVVRDEFGISDQHYGWLTSAFLGAYALGQLLTGPVIDRLGTRLSFTLAAALWSLSTMLHALGRGVASFLVLRISLGLTEAANFPAALKAVAQWFPASERSTAVGIFMLGAGAGSIITPPLAAGLIENFGWEWAFLVPGGIGLVWAWFWHRWFRLPEDHPRISPAERDFILAERAPQQAGEGWAELLKHREFWGLMISRFVSDGPFYFFVFWLPLYLADERGFNLREIGLFAWIPFVAADLGAWFGGWLSSRIIKNGRSIDFSRKFVIWLGALLMLGAMPAATAGSPYVAIALISLGMFSIQVKSSVFFTLPSDLFSAGRVASVWGAYGAVGSLGAALFAPMAGWLIQNYSYRPLFVAVSLLPILSAALLMIFVPRIRQLSAA